MLKIRTGSFYLVLVLCLALSVPAKSAVFDIYPVRIFMDSKNRTEKVVIKNLDSKELQIQVRVFSWDQTEQGEDKYEETNEIVIFPKILKIKPSEEKVIRVGCQVPPDGREKTYRIMVEELPPVEQSNQQGVRINILLKVSVPIFLSPVAKKRSGEMEFEGVKDDTLLITVNNNGNVHFIASQLKIKGTDRSGSEIFSTTQNGWYILAGRKKQFSVKLDPKIAEKLFGINVVVHGDEGFGIEKWFQVAR